MHTEQAQVYRSSSLQDKRLDSRSQVAAEQSATEAQAKACAPIVTITPERIAELRSIAEQFPGAHRHIDRVEFALLKGPLNSVEALFLGSLHIPARILALRERGYEITSRWVRVMGFDGELHRVHEWTLVGNPAEADRAAAMVAN